jgi:hypothetical protein
MSVRADEWDCIEGHCNIISPAQKGYLLEAEGITTRAGSAYRLEVEVEGYKMVTSTSVMPFPPVVSASIDTTVTVYKKNIIDFSSLRGYSYSSGEEGNFWPVSLQWGERNVGRNYYALEMHEQRVTIEGAPEEWNKDIVYNTLIHADDITKLRDNPEIEISESQGLDLDRETYAIYGFSILLMTDMGFTHDNAMLQLFKKLDPSLFIEPRDEWYPPEYYEKVVQQCTLTLRVRQITPATFNYYRSLALQGNGLGFFTEPVNIVGNIENGYGLFSVFNATDIELLDYKVISYRYIGPYSLNYSH